MRKVSFRNSRGLELKGDLRENSSDAAIILSHGLLGDREEKGYFTELAEALHQEGFNVLSFDFSGRGRSEGSLSIENGVDDLKSAIKFSREKGAEKIGLIGYSMGGLISLKTMNDVDVEAAFLTSPVTASFDLPGGELTDFALKLFGEIPKIELGRARKVNWISRELSREFMDVDQEELLSGLEEPVKIVHGDRDRIVNVENSRRAEKLLENCELQVVEGVKHNYSAEDREEIVREAKAWFTEHMQV